MDYDLPGFGPAQDEQNNSPRQFRSSGRPWMEPCDDFTLRAGSRFLDAGDRSWSCFTYAASRMAGTRGSGWTTPSSIRWCGIDQASVTSTDPENALEAVGLSEQDAHADS